MSESVPSKTKRFYVPGKIFSLKITCLSEAEHVEKVTMNLDLKLLKTCRITLVKIMKNFTVIFYSKMQYIF